MFTDILWDFDGTLFNTYPSIAMAFKKALEDERITVEDDVIFKLIKRSMMFAYQHFKSIYQLKDDFMERVNYYDINADKSMTPPFPFAKEVCLAFKEKGGRNLIYTHRGNSIFDFLDHYGMTILFADIVTIDYGFKRKPEPEGFLYIIEKHNVNKNKMLAVGDRSIDMSAANSAGIKCCFFDYEGGGCDIKHDYEIKSLYELSDLLSLNLHP